MGNNQKQKFRAFYQGDIENRYNLVFYSQINDDCMWFVCSNDSEIRYKASYVFGDDDWVINEFTGKKDKQGNLIYEGDILPFKLTNGTIEHYYIRYNKEECGYEAVNKDDTNFIHPSLWSESEVVGNIYFNEVLLDNSKLTIGSLQIIKLDNNLGFYRTSRWYNDIEKLQDDIDETYQDIENMISHYQDKIDNIYSRNLWKRIWNKKV